MFGHDSLPSKIFSFAVVGEPDNRNLAIEQMKLANAYRNKLVEIDLWRREEIRAAGGVVCEELTVLDDAISALEEDMEAARAAVKRRNQLARQRTGTVDDRATVAEIKEQLSLLRGRSKDLRALIKGDPTLIERYAEISAEAVRREKVCRAEHSQSIYWGTRNVMEQAVKSARNKPTIRFHGFRGEGKVAVQIQGGMSVSRAVLDSDSRLQLKIPTNGTTAASALIRVQSTERGGPVWARVSFVLQRTIPHDGQIKWVYLVRRREHGTHWKWYVQFVVAREGGFPRENAAKCGAVGIDLGWRTRPSGLRVAYWCGSDDAHGELVLPIEDGGRWARADHLRSIRDRLFDGMRETLVGWLGGRELAPDWLRLQQAWFRQESDQQRRRAEGQDGRRKTHHEKEAMRLAGCAESLGHLADGWAASAGAAKLPDWLLEGTAHLHAWRSTARLAGLTLRWREVENRFLGDGLIYPVLEAWRRTDKHLYDWECSEREKAVRWRDDIFRNFAADMANRYRLAVVEGMNLKDLRRRPKPEEVNDFSQTTRNNAQIAAVGRLRTLVKEAMSETISVPAKDTTGRCYVCGLKRDFDRVELERKCDGCDRIHDQDYNAAMNLLAASGEEMVKTLGIAR